jgi:hypothetical protein
MVASIKNHWLRGAVIVVGSLILSALILASAVAWGPHHCEEHNWSIRIAGCALGSYENLSGGLFAACAAIFAGWMAWTAVQLQISADERRAVADRAEVESELSLDIDTTGEALAAVWKVLDVITDKVDRDLSLAVQSDLFQLCNGVERGITEISRVEWVQTVRNMASGLGWKRRRLFEQLCTSLDHLRSEINDDHDYDPDDLLMTVKRTSYYVRAIDPKTEESFEGLHDRGGKAWSLGYMILIHAELEEG